ncbi:Inner membrane protein yeiU [Salmonella enterica subsp. enterica]|uniref:Inner membrane protein yeiU n=1 Tax=Salmonella enterica I TaxID=59201 RepID=A0A447TZT3_SALET|nr:Inner membrane protein yeiU [Salmonella enterica subsp. enterica]
MPPVWRCFCHGIFPSITVSGSPLIPAYSTSLTRKLVESHAFLWWVAITNNRAFDGCSLLAMGGLMLSFWLKENASGRRAHCDNRIGHAANSGGA